VKAAYSQRLRFAFRKEGMTRYISHLDLARALERALNRARLPVAYSQGFNRRPRMQLAAALPLGFSSEHELVDVWLKEETDPQEAKRRLVAKMAPGIEIFSVRQVPLSDPALQNATSEAIYRATLLDAHDEADIKARVLAVMAADSLVRQIKRGRKVKTYDLRPLIIELAVSGQSGPKMAIDMRLHLKPGMTGRPDEVLRALDIDPFDARVHRMSIVLADSPHQRHAAAV
jgi:radical SAM-linked protein